MGEAMSSEDPVPAATAGSPTTKAKDGESSPLGPDTLKNSSQATPEGAHKNANKEVFSPVKTANTVWQPSPDAEPFVPSETKPVKARGAGRRRRRDAEKAAQEGTLGWNEQGIMQVTDVDYNAMWMAGDWSQYGEYGDYGGNYWDASSNVAPVAGKSYKTTTCWHWQRGRCNLGEACHFAHATMPDLQSQVAAAQAANAIDAGAVPTGSSPRAALLTMCGAWGALATRKPLGREELLRFRYSITGEDAPVAEFRHLKCVNGEMK